MPRDRNRKRKPYPSQRYGAAHRAMRARLAPVVATGTVKCARCEDLIEPTDEWQLDHRDDGRGWLGASHKRCNLSAGWQKMVANAAGNGSPELLEETPRLWSQRWHNDPPVGTRVILGRDGTGQVLCEVYLGGGRWSEPAPFERDGL